MAILPIREWMESQSRDALCIVSHYVAGGPEYCAKINFVPSDGIFNLGECEMLILAGRGMDIVECPGLFYWWIQTECKHIWFWERALNQAVKMVGHCVLVISHLSSGDICTTDIKHLWHYSNIGSDCSGDKHHKSSESPFFNRIYKGALSVSTSFYHLSIFFHSIWVNRFISSRAVSQSFPAWACRIILYSVPDS